MAEPTQDQIEHIIELLREAKPLPAEYKKILFPTDRKEYELVYDGKLRDEDILAGTMSVPLQPVKTFGTAVNGWSNMLIFGDNLQAMRTLLRMKEDGKLVNADGSHGAKLIYLDPPFASKQEFTDRQNERAYQDKIAGAKFVEFIRRRLIMIRELLAPSGSVFLHMDQRKVHYIKVILDEVFGEHNFRNEIVLPGRASKNLQQQFEKIARLNVRHDSLLWYSRSNQTRFSPLWVEKHHKGNPEGHWHHFWSTADRPTMRYELFGITPSTGQWTWKEDRARRAIENYERFLEEGGGRTLAEYWRDTGRRLDFIRQDEEGKPLYWRPPSEIRLADTVWSGVPVYDNITKYPTEKHETLLQHVIELASEEGDIVLDPFAGSGTTLAAAEKLNRKWVGIDCGKLSIYTIQKRILDLHRNLGQKYAPFTLYSAGLYDFPRLSRLPWEDWKLFALQLFEAEVSPHVVAGVQLDGYRRGHDVLVFNHLQEEGVVLDYGFIDDLHGQLKGKVGEQFFLIAPAASVAFLEDYVDRDDTRYYILRIPYSIINELHNRDFEAIVQPLGKDDINQSVEAVGFDFIRLPRVECEYLAENDCAVIRIARFESRAMIKGTTKKKNRETLSMVMVDLDFDGNVFDLDRVFYANDVSGSDWKIHLPLDDLGDQVMIIYLDVFGNEYREVKTRHDFKADVASSTSEAK